jgi:hypothetical protein
LENVDDVSLWTEEQICLLSSVIKIMSLAKEEQRTIRFIAYYKSSSLLVSAVTCKVWELITPALSTSKKMSKLKINGLTKELRLWGNGCPEIWRDSKSSRDAVICLPGDEP